MNTRGFLNKRLVNTFVVEVRRQLAAVPVGVVRNVIRVNGIDTVAESDVVATDTLQPILVKEAWVRTSLKLPKLTLYSHPSRQVALICGLLNKGRPNRSDWDL